MDIKYEEGRFYIEDNETLVGEITFMPVKDDPTIAIDHTYVNDKYRGLGVARKLLDSVINYAKDNELKIYPLCSYARSVFDKEKDIRDILNKQYLNNLLQKEAEEDESK